MKKLLTFLFAVILTNPSYGASLLKYPPGFRTIDGSQLNKMVDVVNGVSGNGGLPQIGYFSLNSAASGPTPQATTVLQGVGADAANVRAELDSFGGIPILTLRRADGTKAAPTAVQSTEELGSVNFWGYGTSAYSATASARLSGYATENWSTTAHGTKIIFSTTPNTSITLTDVAQIDQDGTFSIGAILANDSSLGVTGQAAAQGGDIAVTGGTSSTSANNGGNFLGTGGTPGVTGNGGTITLAGGIGGATSGNGGAVSLTGGAGTNGNGVGGAASLIGGLGQGSAAGGAITITSGAAGATGVAGAVNVSVGAATAGAGSSMTLTAGNGAGGTAAGGNVNLVPGTAVSTGVPGVVQFNGNSGIACPAYYFTGTIAANNQVFFLATRAMRLMSISEVHSVAAGGASTMDIIKDTGTTAPAGGSTIMNGGTFNLNATANTVQAGTPSTTIATVNMAAGDRLSVKYNNAIQASAGVVVTACLAPV